MAVDANTLQSLIEAELTSLRDERVEDHIRTLLVAPHVILRPWDYGAPDQAYPCWTVLDHGDGSDTGIAYCEHGFGPRCPWGLVWMGRTAGRSLSMGMDSGWFRTFLDAYFESFAASDLPIWRLFTREDAEPGEPLSEELSWNEAWRRCEEARRNKSSEQFMVHHTIRHGARA